MLDTKMYNPRFTTYGFPYSQQAVYSMPAENPLFTNGTPNMEYILHIANFFRFHIKTAEENTLHKAFSALQDKHKPQAWKRAPFQGLGVKPLGKQWKGAYGKCKHRHLSHELKLTTTTAYLPDQNDVTVLRELKLNGKHKTRHIICPDEFENDKAFHSMDFDFSPQGNTVAWPKAFEDHLHAMPSTQHCLEFEQEARKNLRRKVLDARGVDLVPVTSKRIKLTTLHTNIGSPLPSPSALSPVSPQTPTFAPTLMAPRKGRDYLPFCGTIEAQGKDVYGTSGILHNIKDQEGIPGFQRVSFMKFKMNVPDFSAASTSNAVPYTPSLPPTSAVSTHFPFGTEDDDDMQVTENTWCYEGIVLPGGHMILGRWWSPVDDDEQRATGPFVYWCVDE